MSWSNDLNAIMKKSGKDLGELVQNFKIDVFTGVVKTTRVDTGRLKGNWQISENAPASGTLEKEDSTPIGQISASMVKDIGDKSTKDGITYFVNNLPYAQVYEEEDAMVRRSIARVKQNIKNAAKRITG